MAVACKACGLVVRGRPRWALLPDSFALEAQERSLSAAPLGRDANVHPLFYTTFFFFFFLSLKQIKHKRTTKIWPRWEKNDISLACWSIYWIGEQYSARTVALFTQDDQYESGEVSPPKILGVLRKALSEKVILKERLAQNEWRHYLPTTVQNGKLGEVSLSDTHFCILSANQWAI